jgi:hypothetical protein
MNLFVFLILIAGFIAPFLIQIVKLHIARTKDVPALLLSLALDLILACLVIWFSGAGFGLITVLGTSILVFAVAMASYTGIVARFFPGKESD